MTDIDTSNWERGVKASELREGDVVLFEHDEHGWQNRGGPMRILKHGDELRAQENTGYNWLVFDHETFLRKPRPVTWTTKARLVFDANGTPRFVATDQSEQERVLREAFSGEDCDVFLTVEVRRA